MREFLKQRWIFPGLALSLLLIQACGQEGNGYAIADTQSPSPKPKSVNVVKAEARPLQERLERVGSLSACLKVDAATEIGGTIERLYFEKGDIVKKGQLLANIGTESIRIEVLQAKAALALAESNLKKVQRGSRPEETRMVMAGVREAEAAFDEAEDHYRRIRDLHELRAVSNSEFDSARRALEMARASLEAARQQLELSKKGARDEDREAAKAARDQAKAALALAEDRLKKSRVPSPCDGVIALRDLEEGEVAGPGTIITRVVDNSRMKIGLSLSERDITLMKRDKDFSFTVDAIPGEEFRCRLLFISPTADPRTRSFPIELEVDKRDQRMADGMTVRVMLPLWDQKRSIKVSMAWLSEEEGRLGLFVVEDGRARFKEVLLGSYYRQRVEILSGLHDGEPVITNPAGLRTGDPVTY